MEESVARRGETGMMSDMYLAALWPPLFKKELSGVMVPKREEVWRPKK